MFSDWKNQYCQNDHTTQESMLSMVFFLKTRGESKEELNRLLMKVKETSEKAGLKLSIHGTWSYHLMADRKEKM